MTSWILAIVCTAFGLIGSWYYGNKKILGPILCTIALAGWIVYDILNEQWALIFFPTMFNIAIQVRNIWKWRTTSD